MANSITYAKAYKDKLDVVFKADDKTKTILERVATTCPVHYSLHPDIVRDITFKWN